MQGKRSDKGQIRFNERDIGVLTWIGEQYGVRLDTLQKLLGRDALQETLRVGQVTPSTARRVLGRWKQEALVESRKLFYAKPEWVWLTGRGLRQMGLPFKGWTPNVSVLEHLYALNEIRLRLETDLGGGIRWQGERALRHAHWNQQDFHIPDGEVHLAGEVYAVEVERTQKSMKRVAGIVDKLSRQYDGTWYFVNPQTRPVIQRAIQRQPERFRLYDIEKVAM